MFREIPDYSRSSRFVATLGQWRWTARRLQSQLNGQTDRQTDTHTHTHTHTHRRRALQYLLRLLTHHGEGNYMWNSNRFIDKSHLLQLTYRMRCRTDANIYSCNNSICIANGLMASNQPVSINQSNDLFCFAAKVLDYYTRKIQETLMNIYTNIKLVKKLHQ